MGRATEIILTEEEEKKLRGWLRSGTTEQRLVHRARIILEAAAGKTTQEVAQQLKIWPSQVSKWRKRFAAQRTQGLQDAPRSGKPRHYDETTEERILAALDEKPPRGYATWNGRLLAEHLGDVSRDQVWRVLQRHRISLQRRRSWCLSTDPEFARKAADIVGLYLAPPENAVVLCIDEKPHMQALERSQGWLKLPNGKAITGENHRYKRNGNWGRDRYGCSRCRGRWPLIEGCSLRISPRSLKSPFSAPRVGSDPVTTRFLPSRP